MIIDGLEDLNIEDEFFSWCGVTYRYEYIRSIKFYAQNVKHSVNLIPTGSSYDAQLTLTMHQNRDIAVRHTGRALFKHEKQRQAMHAIWQAKEILSEMSFKARVSFFEQSALERNFFVYQNYQFHKDGDVFQSGRKLFNISDHGFKLNMSPFELHLSPQRTGLSKLFGSDTIIRTDMDEDCLYYMLSQFYGYVWKDRPIRTKMRPIIDPKKVFLRTMLKLAAKIAVADGEVSADELTTFKTHFGITRDSFPEAGQIFNDALKSRESPAEIAFVANQTVAESREFREYIVIGLIKIAIADGTYHPHEHQIIEEVAKALGFTSDNLEHILAMCGIFHGHSHREQDMQTSGQANIAAFHCKVLGLASTATLAEIKLAWRTLVLVHHPDRLQAAGVPASDIKASEEVLKAINTSYAWLKNLHGAAV